MSTGLERELFPELAKVAQKSLRLIETILAQRGLPSDTLTDRVVLAEVRKKANDWPSPSDGFSMLSRLTSDFLGEVREAEEKVSTGGHYIGSNLALFPIYSNDGFDVERFIITLIGQDVAPRCFPVAFPVDIVAFGSEKLQPADTRLRFFCGLIRVYSDAVCLSGNVVGLSGQLVRTLGLLYGFLRDAMRDAGVDEADDAGSDSDDLGHVHGASLDEAKEAQR